MTKMIVSSPLFKGNAELIYDQQGMLVVIDLNQALMTGQLIDSFKTSVPVSLNHLEERGIKGFNAVVVQTDYVVTFDMFWNAYDKKINRKRSIDCWERLSKPQQVAAYYGIKKYNDFLKKNEWRKKLDPENYLKNLCWENEWK